MNILMLNYEYPPLGGGGGVIFRHLAEELAKRHRVSVVTSAFTGLPANETIGGVDIHRVRVMGRRSLATASLPSLLSFHNSCVRKGQQVAESIEADLINSHFAVPTGLSGVRLAQKTRLPHVLTVHGGDLYDPSKLLSPHRIFGLRHTVKWVLRNSDLVTAQSINTSDNAKRIYDYDEPIEIIPHGLPEPILPPYDRRELGLSEDHTVLINVGRLIKRKANHQLLHILSRLRNPRVTLVLIGEGPDRPRLESLAKQLDIEQQVLFAGHATEQHKLQLMQAADVFVSTTQHEGFGLMYLEGMFCGLPVITYDNGGQRDFLIDQEMGFLIPHQDQSAFQSAIERVIREPKLRQAMGDFNRRRAQEFCIENCAAKYEAAFERLLSGGAAHESDEDLAPREQPPVLTQN